MRVENWDPHVADELIMNASMERINKAAEVLAGNARALCKVGTISRPMYKKGPYAGQNWTARDAGMLKKSIRVVEKSDIKGYYTSRTIAAEHRNVRVYAGHYLAWYAAIVEFYTSFLRRAMVQSVPSMKNVLENG